MLELTLTARDLAYVRFAYSPLWEVVASVRVLKSPPGGSRHRAWIDAVAPRLRSARLDLTLLSDLIPVPTRMIPAFLAPPPTTSAPDLGVELAGLRAQSAEAIRVGLDMLPTPRTAAIAELHDDPASVLPHLAETIEAYWRLALSPYWARIRGLCERDILYRARLLAEGGVRRLFADLDPMVSWDGERLRVDHKHVSRRDDAAGLGLLLTPSVFVWPTVFSLTTPPWQPTLRYGPRGIGMLWKPEPQAVPEALAAVLGRSRAMLLSTLDEPESTTALAMRTGLTAGAVSQHLGVLKDSGLVGAHRSGRYVLYARTELGESLVTGGKD
ncbi:DUF5937 family protein [Phytomonospora sp. NPDC050363]|uniref:ArsR/SmtB family transcription factor n=1 Tax=Phytomonospora sp. NPDC050363 TaxID=3155642 RepID=UPI00340076A3